LVLTVTEPLSPATKLPKDKLWTFLIATLTCATLAGATIEARATQASILGKHDIIAALLFGMGILVVYHSKADIVSGGSGITGGI
jgi:hypothetical protein